MRTWWLPFVFPVGLLGAVMLLSLGSLSAQILALVWTLVIVPGSTCAMMRRSPEGRARLAELEAHYWRSGPR